ncbi:MAG: NAD+ synthase [Phycisphaerales bacterium]|nr:NAD+ synthase [Phycisphaerales bacterium]
MRIGLAQINTTVGDVRGNLRKHLECIRRARDAGTEVVVFPELSVLGYPPRDLVMRSGVVERCVAAVEEIAGAAQGIVAMVGTVERNTSQVGRALHNAVAVVSDGKVLAKRFKSLLPTYDVFDEARYFEPGELGKDGDAEIVCISGRHVGISICEDLWNDEKFIERPRYHFHPIETLANAEAEMLFNISASPFGLRKNEYRRKLFAFQAKRWKLPIVYVNQVGGNDELVFDGNSVVFDHQGNILAQAKDFEEDLIITDIPPSPLSPRHPVTLSPCPPPHTGIASVRAALVLGLRDYVRKCGMKSVVLGLSGGIDSAVVAVIAVEALGAENVLGVGLPSRYSSEHSKVDAAALAKNLGIRFETVLIEEAHRGMEVALGPLFAGTREGVAEENIQARVRGNILMAISNKFGHMLLTTGNKSEIAVGYCTLYGDTCGGLAVLADVPKTMVYELARGMNTIPESTITKPPSAELKPGQVDQDSLPPYEVLDAIVELYVEREKNVEEIVAAGFDASVVSKVVRLIDLSEHKRKQMAPGIKISGRAFGSGRRMPVAQGFDAK